MKRALAALVLLAPRAAFAQELPPDPSQPPDARDDEHDVRIVGSKADSLQRVPGSGTVITEEQLRRQQPVDTAEALRRVPGVQVRQEYSGGSRIDISIRGLEAGRSRRVLMLEDGIPLALNPYSEPDMNHAPVIENYRAIEVVKGSGNILFGPQTLAGTINFVTINPPDHQSIVADADYGNYNYFRGLARYGDTLLDGDVRYVVQVLDRRGDGFRDQPYNQISALAKVIFPTGNGGEARLKLGFQQDDASSDDIGLTSAMYAANPRRPTLSPDAHSIMNRYDVSLIHDQELGANTKLKTLVYGYQSDRIWRRPDWTRSPEAGDGYLRVDGDPSVTNGAVYFENSNTVLDRDYTVFGVEPRLEHRMKTAFVEHTIDFGGRALQENAHYQQRSGSYPQTYSGALDFEQKRRSYAAAGYVQDRMAFSDKLLVTPGIRVEYVSSTTYTLRQSDVDMYSRGTKPTTGVIPGIGIVYGTKSANVFGNMHYGFAPPRITSSISARGPGQTLEGDRGISYEVGTRNSMLPFLRAELTGFLSNYSNQVDVTPDALTGESQLADVGATNIYGIETGESLLIDKLLKLQTIVELGVRYTFSHATFRYGPSMGNFLPYAPEHSLNANFDVELRSGLGGQLGYTFVSNQFADGANTRAEDVTGIVGEIASYQIWDATVHYHWARPGLTFRLSGKNALDSTYVIARRPEGIFPGPFRQLILGLRWEWENMKKD